MVCAASPSPPGLSSPLCYARASLHYALGSLLELHAAEFQINRDSPRTAAVDDALWRVVEALAMLEYQPPPDAPPAGFDQSPDSSGGPIAA